MEGWIKLHRKIMDNRIYQHDQNATRVFIHLLLTVDKKTGSRDTGRFRLADELVMNPNTIYASLKRLEKAKMITQASNNKYSVISICKWEEYQGNGNSDDNNKITTGQQQDNTIQELRIKNKEIYNTIETLTDDVCKEIAKQKQVSLNDVLRLREDLQLYCLSKKPKYKNYKATLLQWLNRKLDEGKIQKVKIEVYTPPAPVLTEEKRLENLKKLQEMKAKIGGN